MPRSTLTLSELRNRAPEHSTTRMINVKLPTDVIDAIGKLAHKLGASKRETVIALLYEGLRVAKQRSK